MKRKLHLGHVVLAALAVTVVVVGIRAAQSLTSPLPSLPPFTAPYLADIDLLKRFDPFAPALKAQGEDLPVTTLPLSLHGVRADSATGQGSAIIAAGEGEQKVYVIGDMVTDGVTLDAIVDDHVVLLRGSVRETLWLDNSGGGNVQRYDPTAYDPISEQTITSDDGEEMPVSDSPSPAPGPSSAQDIGQAVEAAAQPLKLNGDTE